MSPIDIIRYPLDFCRTAPVGLTIGSICSWAEVETVSGFLESPSIAEAIIAGELAVAAFFGGALALRQFRQRNRIKETIEQYGFEPRMMARTTPEWCSRQTVRTVLRRTGHLEEYKQLCEERKDRAKLGWLPHF